MSKGAVIAAVVVGGVVILGGAALAMAAPKPNPYPLNLGPAPPPPPSDSLGRYLVQQGGAALDELGKNDWVKSYTGGSNKQLVTSWAINPYYAAAKGIAGVGKKLLGSVF